MDRKCYVHTAGMFCFGIDFYRGTKAPPRVSGAIIRLHQCEKSSRYANLLSSTQEVGAIWVFLELFQTELHTTGLFFFSLHASICIICMNTGVLCDLCQRVHILWSGTERRPLETARWWFIHSGSSTSDTEGTTNSLAPPKKKHWTQRHSPNQRCKSSHLRSWRQRIWGFCP